MCMRPYINAGFIFLIAVTALSCSSSSDKPVSAIQTSTAAHEQVAEKVQKIVTDTKRADEAVSITEQMFKETEGFLDLVIESRKKAIELSENHDTTREILEAHYEIFLQQRKEHAEKYTVFNIDVHPGKFFPAT